MINSPSPHPPTVSKIQRHYEITFDTLIFPCPPPVDVSRQKSVLLHNHYDAFIFHLWNAMGSDAFHLIFISYLACRIGPVKVPRCLTFPIAVRLTHCFQLHLPWAPHALAQKQANKCPQKFNVYFLFPFCLGNKIQTV